MSQDVRLRFSGLMIFSARIISTFTGIGYAYIVVRSLSQPEYGAWTNITGVIGTFTLASGIFPFWTARYTARGFKGAMKLGLAANLAIGVMMALIAALVGPVLAAAANTSAIYYAYAAIVALQTYAITLLDATISVRKTHVIGYAIIFYEIIKLALVVVFVAFFHIGILGALTATFFANLGWMLVYGLYLRNLWSEKVDYGYLRQWLKGSFLNVWGVGESLVGSLAGFIFLFRGGVIALSFWGVASVLTTPISYTNSLSTALYPKMLTGGTSEDVETVWRMTLLFAIPLTLAVITLAPSFLILLKVDYLPATLVVSLLAVKSLLQTIGGIFDAIIGGTARFDAQGSFTLKDMVKSRIFWSTAIGYAAFAIYLPALWILLQPYHDRPLEAAEIVALSQIPFSIGVFGLKGVLARRSMPLRFPWKSTSKFLLVSGLITSVSLLAVQPLPYFLTILLFVGGSALYFGVLYFIEEEARLLIDSIMRRAIMIFRSVNLFR